MSAGGSYDPETIEPEIYALWERSGAFHAEPPKRDQLDPARPPFSIVIPPPNVTGALHLGHALNNTLQDILVRRARMQGFATCWLPGTDHAGIATQAVVEKRVRQEEGKSRHELGREGLIARISAWKDEYEQRILGQLRRMGCSCDWDRTRFTLDEQCAKAVYELFFRLFKDGLIYRGKRLVNWDCELQTAVADDEVYHETVKGHLWHIRYPILDAAAADNPQAAAQRAARPDAKLGADYLVVATTRPETMLADTAVAVHPDDPRYKHLIGRRALLPLMQRPIPVIADGLLVNPEFGTGCVKVTPGHDPNDYACWQRHQGRPDEFGIIDLLTPDGKINEHGKGQIPARAASGSERTEPPAPAHDYAGLSRQEARKRVVADLEALGLLEKVEPYETDIGHSDRSKSPIEPLRSEQWFVKMDKLAEAAMEAVRDGRVRIFPPRFARSYLDWLAEKRDWCISRQLWWGHRIPVWRVMLTLSEGTWNMVMHDWGIYRLLSGKLVPVEDISFFMRRAHDDFIVRNPARDLKQPTPEFQGWYSLTVCPRDPSNGALVKFFEENVFEQDPDVLDTWFSSALWPLSTFGWPAQEGDADFAYFFPTSVLSTARDIISLWVARMVMVSLYTTGRVPFQHVCIHPTIQDAQGRRMSKSAGNGVDPLDLIEMYGADAMRFTLASMAGETQDVRIPVQPAQLPDGRTVNTSERFELGRNFCNKLWQAATGFVIPNLRSAAAETAGGGAASDKARPEDEAAELALEDRWILSRLAATIDACDRCLSNYQYSEYAGTMYAFFWSDFCDWYVELVKPRLYGDRSETGPAARRVLALVLDATLRLLHPVIPFVTERLWALLNEAAPRRGLSPKEAREAPALLITAPWPRSADVPRDAEAEAEIGAVQQVIRAVREIRTHVNATRAANKEPALRSLPRAVVRTDEGTRRRLEHSLPALQRLGQCEAFEIGPDAARPPESMSKILTGIEVYVPVSGLVDLSIERRRLDKERGELVGYIGRVSAKLSNESFVAKAPPAVVEAERTRLAELREKLAKIDDALRELGGNE